MRDRIQTTFERYGLSVSVTHAGQTVQTKAFIQPLTKESKEEPFSVAPLGAVDERCWRYLGPASVRVEMGDRVRCGSECYVARNAAAVYFGDEVAYYRAVLRREEASA